MSPFAGLMLLKLELELELELELTRGWLGEGEEGDDAEVVACSSGKLGFRGTAAPLLLQALAMHASWDSLREMGVGDGIGAALPASHHASQLPSDTPPPPPAAAALLSPLMDPAAATAAMGWGWATAAKMVLSSIRFRGPAISDYSANK